MSEIVPTNCFVWYNIFMPLQYSRKNRKVYRLHVPQYCRWPCPPPKLCLYFGAKDKLSLSCFSSLEIVLSCFCLLFKNGLTSECWSLTTMFRDGRVYYSFVTGVLIFYVKGPTFLPLNGNDLSSCWFSIHRTWPTTSNILHVVVCCVHHILSEHPFWLHECNTPFLNALKD